MDLCGLARLLYLNQGIAEVLSRGGWDITRLATLHEAEEDAVYGLLDWLGRQVGDDEEVETGEVHDLISAAHEAARVAWAAEGIESGADLYVDAWKAKREYELTQIRDRRIKEVAKLIPVRGKAKREHWPSCRERKLEAAGDDHNQRERIESDERDRWHHEAEQGPGHGRLLQG